MTYRGEHELYARKDDAGHYQTLEEHLKETAAFAGCFAEPLGLREFGFTLGALHDLGKMQERFQKKLRDGTNETVDHSGAAALFFKRKCDAATAELLGLTSVSHHGGLMNSLGKGGESDFYHRLERSAERFDLEADVVDEYVDELFGKLDLPDAKKLCALLERIPDAGRDAKNGNYRLVMVTLLVKFLYSCLVDADRLNSAGFTISDYREESIEREMSERVDARVRSFPCSPLGAVRTAIYKEASESAALPKGLFSLNVPTGGGKTLTSLKFALRHAETHRLKRVIYVVPYLSIIEQNAAAIRDVLGERYRVSESHSNVVNERVFLQENREDASQEDRNEARTGYRAEDNYNAPIVFTTMVQFLENVFGPGTRGIRRFHAYTDSVLIFDEIQALPLKCVCLFNALVKFLTSVGNSSVVLCSATQPGLDRLAAYSVCRDRKPAAFSLPEPRPIVREKHDFSVFHRNEIVDYAFATRKKAIDIPALVEEKLKNFRSVLVICNTKRAAQKIYAEVRVPKKYFLSTDLCAAHRLRVIETLKARDPDEPTVCVSTQLIEAGVDLDFGCVIRSAAGIDSIVQAAGRCNREGKLRDDAGRKRAGEVLVVDMRENLSSLPEIEDARKHAEEAVIRFPEKPLDDPDVVDKYYDCLFASNALTLSYPIGRQDEVSGETSEVELLGQNKGRLNYSRGAVKFLPQSFRDAADRFSVIESRQIGVIVPYGEGVTMIRRLLSNPPDFSALWEAQRYTVNVFPEDLSRRRASIVEIGDTGVYAVTNESAYDPVMGLSKEVPAQAIVI